MLVRTLGLVVFLVSLATLAGLVVTTLLNLEPELKNYSWTRSSILTLTPQGDIALFHLQDLFYGTPPPTGLNLFEYRIEVSLPPRHLMVPPPLDFEFGTCRAYVFHDVRKAARVESQLRGLSQAIGVISYYDPEEYEITRALVNALADEKVEARGTRLNGVPVCRLSLTTSQYPRLLLVEVRVPLDTISGSVGGRSVDGDWVAWVIEEASRLIVNASASQAGVVSVTVSPGTANASSGTAPMHVVTLFYDLLSALYSVRDGHVVVELVEYLSQSELRVTAVVKLGAGDLWRALSLVMAGFLILVVDAGRNPQMYERGWWRVFRRIASLLGISGR